MTGPEDAQTDIIPAQRTGNDTAVDLFPPVGGARHRAAHRPSRGRAVGVAAIVAAAVVVGYGTYTLRPPAPEQRVGVPPAAESAEPTTTKPSSPLVRPSRTRADRHRTRTPSPSPTRDTPSPRQTPTSPTPTPRLSASPTVTRPVAQSPDPSTAPSPSGTPSTSPSTSPQGSPS